MNKTIILREYQTLGYQQGKCDAQISRKEWDEIRDYVQDNPDAEGRQAMEVRAGTIRAANYVGVLQTSRGTTIEILPKVDLGQGKGQGEEKGEDIEREREIFLRMLRRWRDGPCRNFNDADVRALKNFPLLEAFIGMFLRDMQELTRRGLACAYNEVEENRHTLKGKLLIAKNLRHNLIHRERFYVQYQEFSANRPINRLLKSTLLLLQRLSRSETNLWHIRQARLYFEDIPSSSNIDADLGRARVDRTMPLYDRLFPWARLFLKRASPTTWKAANPALALLFPMEKIFEDYVAHLVRIAAADKHWRVSTQDKRHYLTEKNPDCKPEFQLRPDIVARCGAGAQCKVRVMDSKWKRLNRDDKQHHYGISQSDLYQMYAYGKKYRAPDLYLLYPRNNNFLERLEYEYEPGLRLTIFPVDLREEKPLCALLDHAGMTCKAA